MRPSHGATRDQLGTRPERLPAVNYCLLAITCGFARASNIENLISKNAEIGVWSIISKRLWFSLKKIRPQTEKFHSLCATSFCTFGAFYFSSFLASIIKKTSMQKVRFLDPGFILDFGKSVNELGLFYLYYFVDSSIRPVTARMYTV